ncbi:hypothetical protein CEXT_630061, partial [Caerostris extrusa]
AVSFKNGIPGIWWIQDFKKRWSKEISIIKQNLLIKNGKKSSPYSIVNTFFDSYETVLKDNNLMNSPERIFNLDEAGLNIDELNQGVFLTKYSKKRLKSAPSWKKLWPQHFFVYLQTENVYHHVQFTRHLIYVIHGTIMAFLVLCIPAQIQV